MRYVLATLIFVTSAPAAQRVELDTLDTLSARAESTTTIDLAPEMIVLAMPFLSDFAGESAVRALLSGLDGVYVRTFGDVSYTPDELDAVRRQLVANQWARLVSVDQGDEEVGLWVYRVGDEVRGVFALVAEPDEIVAVNLVGTIDLRALAALGDQLGVPVATTLR